MKKLLLILLIAPLFGFGQASTSALQREEIAATKANSVTTTSLSATDRAILDSIKSNTQSTELYSKLIRDFTDYTQQNLFEAGKSAAYYLQQINNLTSYIRDYNTYINGKLDSLRTAIQSNSVISSSTITVIQASTVQAISAVTATVNLNSSAFGSNYHKWIGVQFIATSLDAADGVVKLQDSNDGTNWNDVGNSITVNSGTSSNMFRYTVYTSSNVRIVWTKGSNTTGTISAIAILKQ